ncbi:MAG: PepSY domain-containing protein [Planctomycetes bacterium]|nr:PepSY domain-containing protein [Planctomycetota bacterium]
MKLYKLFWDTHKWVGIILSIVFLNLAVTGLLLLVKKKYDWIQPATQKGTEGNVADYITIEALFDAVLGAGHEDFQSPEDIDRIDFRPDKRIHKVISVHHNSELQIDAVTGQVLSNKTRRSDLLEQIHDGYFFGDWAHDWLMPLVALGLFFLSASGLYLWLQPKIRKKTRSS